MSDKSDKIDSTSKHGSTSPEANVLKLAEDGFGKGSANYDQNRPNYTEETIDFVRNVVVKEISPTCLTVKYNILELGAGTGKFTEDLLPKLPEETTYLATEPSEDFLNFLQSKSLPISTSIGAANAIPLGNNATESIICAQCFHWFSDEKSLEEMHRVLAPGGRLILLWNAYVYNQDWTQELYKQRMEVVARIGTTSDFWYNSMKWREAIDSSSLFSLTQHKSLPGIKFTSNIDQVIESISTVSLYNALSDTTRKEFLDNLRAAILAWPDVDPNNLSIPYSSEIYVYSPMRKG